MFYKILNCCFPHKCYFHPIFCFPYFFLSRNQILPHMHSACLHVNLTSLILFVKIYFCWLFFSPLYQSLPDLTSYDHLLLQTFYSEYLPSLNDPYKEIILGIGHKLVILPARGQRMFFCCLLSGNVLKPTLTKKIFIILFILPMTSEKLNKYSFKVFFLFFFFFKNFLIWKIF